METPEQIIARAIKEYAPKRIFGLFSGGDDSLTATHAAQQMLGSAMDAVVHINTGIGIPEAREFVDTASNALDWSLLEYKAIDCGQDYEQLVLAYGFPGPRHHTKMFNRLKERPLRALDRDNQGGNNILISGLRKQESGRRMRLKNEPIQKDGRRVWVAPFFYWSNDQIREYRARIDLPKNPVKEYLCMSGECMCGAFAKEGEQSQVNQFFPSFGARLDDLTRRVLANGFPWRWDESPPKWWNRMKSAEKFGQWDMLQDELDIEVANKAQMLCSSCEFKHEAA
jgi:3'-phosphoadenosine 5'-phosphosulfate sulfotransferase (PAPS reductase)/FAD synthetase